MRENKFQAKIIHTIKTMFPGVMVIKQDPNYIQGIPDLLILYKNRWAALECKKDSNATHQPNQDYYINYMNKLSFAKYIYPENAEFILNELAMFFDFGGSGY